MIRLADPTDRKASDLAWSRAGVTLLIDTDEFTRRGERREGEIPLRALERLGSLLSDSGGSLAWQLAGTARQRSDGSIVRELSLQIRGAARVPCARCLSPLTVDLQVAREFLLADNEAQATQLDSMTDDKDVLVGSRRFDLIELIEDEAILALPPVKTHVDCSLGSTGKPASGMSGSPGEGLPGRLGIEPAQPASGARRPFAALAAFKKNSRS